MEIKKFEAINSLGNWIYKMTNDNTNEMTFYNNEGNEISKPSDFPSDADINARQADMQTKADTGNYDTVQAIIATYSA